MDTPKISAWQQMHAAAQAGKEDQKKAHIRLLAASKDRLAKILTTKIRTAFIGSLSVFEEHFGFLWGHGLPETECSAEQLAVRPLWETARQEILNNGNNQLRAAQSEVAQYDVKWNGASKLLLPVRSEPQEEACRSN